MLGTFTKLLTLRLLLEYCELRTKIKTYFLLGKVLVNNHNQTDERKVQRKLCHGARMALLH